jgi:hypothetical protein
LIFFALSLSIFFLSFGITCHRRMRENDKSERILPLRQSSSLPFCMKDVNRLWAYVSILLNLLSSAICYRTKFIKKGIFHITTGGENP